MLAAIVNLIIDLAFIIFVIHRIYECWDDFREIFDNWEKYVK